MNPRRHVRRAALGLAATALAVGGLATGGSTAQAAETTAKAAPSDVRPLLDPGPECTGQSGNCWEYYSWYWTYESCQSAGRQQLASNPGRYNDYNCAGDHGLVVWLWMHRP
ncbi:hypothetical protein [Streptomyces sp. NPDC001348]